MAHKKIAFVSNSSWSLYNFHKNTLKSLMSNGDEVYCIAPRDDFSEKIADMTHYLQIPIDRKGANPINDFKTLVSLCKYYKRENFDVVFAFTIKPIIYSSFACKISGIPLYSFLTGLGESFACSNLKTWIARKLLKTGLKFSRRIFVMNSEDEKLLLKLNYAAKKNLKRFNITGIDTTYFTSKSRKRRTNIVMLSRLLKSKGVLEFLKAAKIIKKKRPEAVLVLAGPLEKGADAVDREMINAYSQYVSYAGVLEDVRPILERAKAFILPTMYFEGVPRSLLEAMLMEVPIITTNTRGCNELIEDGKNGFMIKDNRPETIAEAILKVLDCNDEQIESMGRLGRQKVSKKFDEQRTTIPEFRKISDDI